MKWKMPPDIKIYEALGAIADERISIIKEGAKVYSSSGNKYYTVQHDQKSSSIMANDSGSYWKGYLGYPSIAYLMKTSVISYNPLFSEALKGIKWKDVNTRFKNDFEKTKDFIHGELNEKSINLDEFLKEVRNIEDQIKNLNLSKLGKRAKPPEGY